MDYARMRAIAAELEAYAERLEGAWSVETAEFRRYGKDGRSDG